MMWVRVDADGEPMVDDDGLPMMVDPAFRPVASSGRLVLGGDRRAAAEERRGGH